MGARGTVQEAIGTGEGPLRGEDTNVNTPVPNEEAILTCGDHGENDLVPRRGASKCKASEKN